MGSQILRYMQAWPSRRSLEAALRRQFGKCQWTDKLLLCFIWCLVTTGEFQLVLSFLSSENAVLPVHCLTFMF